MLANLLEMTIAQTGLVTFFLGMGIVFGGIAVLILAVWVIGKILNTSKKEATPTVEEPVPVPVAEEGIPEHIKVAITAAVYAVMAEENNGKCEFVVRKITRRR